MYRQIEKWENIFSYFLNYVNECKKIRREYIKRYNQGKRGFYSKYIDEIDSVNYIDYELLRTLRGKYFHWSVDVTSIAMVPEFYVEISHPDNKYQVTPKDYILTLEGTPIGLPYGSSSGRWADSGKMWTEQLGTPRG